MERPIGIVRTLPYYGVGASVEACRRRAAYRTMMKAFRGLERDDEAFVRIAFSAKPRHEVLYCYLLVGGRVRVRANIAGWEKGTGQQITSWDGHDLSWAKYWALLTAPVVFPPFVIKRRGTQGFRYLYSELW